MSITNLQIGLAHLHSEQCIKGNHILVRNKTASNITLEMICLKYDQLPIRFTNPSDIDLPSQNILELLR